ncbi:unnamed protein product [Mytilus coruscus]|uniref:AAA domain-containing protein n=1 Tax=Mytilus coruscus TaxID=42192 RepID=A0A6J8B4I6_MYTCO|nr:unnamed protein product [Mytilus coruscus]
MDRKGSSRKRKATSTSAAASRQPQPDPATASTSGVSLSVPSSSVVNPQVRITTMPFASYVVWNNKGGTGKTTLTFQLAAEYAKRHHGKTIVVIDMCPQANVSSALLAKSNSPLNPGPVDLEGKRYVKTVCGYLLAKLERVSTEPGKTKLMNFLLKVNSTNKNIPTNVFLMCGDLYLEELSRRLEQERQLMAIGDNSPWKRVTLFIKDYVERLSQKGDFVFHRYKSFLFHLHRNGHKCCRRPNSTVHTADDFSLSAIKAMLYLVYGIQTDENDHRRSLVEHQFYQLAEAHQVNRPQLHLFVNNRVTYHTETAAAFVGIADEVKQLLNTVYEKESGIFSQEQDHLCPDLHDFHSAGVISLHTGIPISKLKQGKYRVFDKEVQVQKNINIYKADIGKIIEML